MSTRITKLSDVEQLLEDERRYYNRRDIKSVMPLNELYSNIMERCDVPCFCDDGYVVVEAARPKPKAVIQSNPILFQLSFPDADLMRYYDDVRDYLLNEWNLASEMSADK